MTEIQETAALELTNAIRELYAAFSCVPRPRRIEFCSCGCTKSEEVTPLLSAPLRELPFTDLANYSFSAMSTQGSVGDFQYFLPRILEGIANEQYDYNPEILFGKLRYSKWENWSETQKSAINAYLRALWLVALTDFPIEQRLPAFCEIETVLSSIAQTGVSITPHLQLWDELHCIAANKHLVQFVTMYGADFSEGRTLSFAFWESSQPQAQELRDWLIKPSTIKRIIEAAPLISQDGYEHLFAPAVATLKQAKGH